LRKLKIETAKVFQPLLQPARYKGIYGGRGSGKSQFYGDLSVEDSLRFPGDHGEGLRLVCIREVQKTLAQSAKKLIENKIATMGLGEADGFKVFKDVITTPKDGIIIFNGMQDHTAESIKSLEGFHRAWTEEAQTLSPRSLQLLRPTIREALSELWFSWNPRRKTDPVDKLLRTVGAIPTNSIVVEANWDDNPWFPDVLNQERLDDLRDRPDSYDHIWEGGYVTAQDGAYYARQLSIAKAEHRIGSVKRDPLMSVYAFMDIGGTGAKADACSIWICQFVGKERRCIDYYEAVGQELTEHVGWMRANNYDDAKIYLPHDGVKHDSVYRVSWESEFKKAGFHVEIMENAGAGAANQRIETSRRVFPYVWLDKEKCEAGIDALGWYHEKRDENRGIGLGPEHDWSSHGCDAFGAMCIESEKLTTVRAKRNTSRPPQTGWMGM
jgi:phage terminase large subunit